jgi:hypothetical protein
MKRKTFTKILCAVLLLTFFCTQPAYANSGLILRGLARTLGAVFQIPKSMIYESCRTTFPLGLVTGALEGTFQTVMGVAGGALDMAQGAAPYAKYMMFLM